MRAVRQETEPWQLRAVCWEEGHGALFSETCDAREHDPVIEEAKRICRRCPVWEECLQEALDKDEQWGVRAAMTGRERRRIQRRVRRERLLLG